MDRIRVALMGVGTIGRELIRRINGDPLYSFVAFSDSRGAIADFSGFSIGECVTIAKHKESGGELRDLPQHTPYGGMVEVLGDGEIDVLVDATAAQTYDTLYVALDNAHVVMANKLPVADVSFDRYVELMMKAEELSKVIDIGVTAGAGLRIPSLIDSFGDEVVRLTGCLSGTMNYLSQRINEGASISEAINEAMRPPRNYSEPDPRVDLSGIDFARKLTIIARVAGMSVERDMIEVEDVLGRDLSELPLSAFIEAMTALDSEMDKRRERARKNGMAIWYLGTADFDRDSYDVGFKDIPTRDPLIGSRESDNSVKIFLRNWRRPVTLVGPGAGAPETVSGMLAGIKRVLRDTP